MNYIIGVKLKAAEKLTSFGYKIQDPVKVDRIIFAWYRLESLPGGWQCGISFCRTPSLPASSLSTLVGPKHTTSYACASSYVAVESRKALASQLPLKIAEFKN